MPPDPERQKKLLADVNRMRDSRDSGYREQALRLFPHVCSRCGREFDGKRLRELTVHHRDHNHHNNPPDGSNWELLCLYCHDYEHQDKPELEGSGRSPLTINPEAALGHNPFAALLPPDPPAKED